MANNYSPKAMNLRAELISKLNQRPTVSALAKTQSFGASQECDLLVGAGTAGSDSAFVRIKVQSNPFSDVLGLAQQTFTPHVAQVVFEANPAGGAGADVGTWATRLAILADLVSTGLRVELYFSNNTVAVSSAAITGTPSAVYDSIQYPLMSTM